MKMPGRLISSGKHGQKFGEDSGKVYGYRKLHDDLLDSGEHCCLNRVARLLRRAGIKVASWL